MPITTRASVLRQAPGTYETVDLELDDPARARSWSSWSRPDCATPTTTSPPATSPSRCSRSAAATRAPVSSPRSVRGARDEIGDHVVFSFLPACGQCPSCARGRTNLCDDGANAARRLAPRRPDTASGCISTAQDVAQMSGISTFSEYTLVDQSTPSCRSARTSRSRSPALVGCGVATGWGSAVNAADVAARDTVIIMGDRRHRINAVQGPCTRRDDDHRRGPVSFKREKAQEIGATHASRASRRRRSWHSSITNGQGADSAIVTIGVTTGEHVGQAPRRRSARAARSWSPGGRTCRPSARRSRSPTSR